MPCSSPTTSDAPSGRSAIVLRRPRPTRLTATAAGLRISAASRLLRDSTESSSATPWRASSSARSRSGSTSACAPRRRASADARLVGAPDRAGRGTARRRRRRAPAARARRRAASAAAGSCAGRASPRPRSGPRDWRRRTPRSAAFSRRGCPAAQSSVDARRDPRIELARVATAGLPLARRVGEVVVQPAALGVLARASSRSRGHSRSSASCATSTVPALSVTRRLAASTSSTPRDRLVPVGLELVERDAAPDRAAARVLAGEAQQDAARDGLLLPVEAPVGGLGEPSDRAAHATAPLVAGERQPLARRAAPRARTARSRAAAARRARARRRPGGGRRARARRAARRVAPAAAIARRSSSRCNGSDEHVVGGEQRAQRRVRGAARRRSPRGRPPPRPRRRRRRRRRRPTNAARSASSRHSVKHSSNWSTTSSRRPSPAAVASARLSARIGRSPGRSSTRLQRSPPGSSAARQPGQQARAQRGGLAAARRPDDPQQRRAGEPRCHLGDEALAAEEELRVADVEGGQALERAPRDRLTALLSRGSLAHRLDLGDGGRQLSLGAPQVAPLDRGTIGHRPQSPGRLGARPFRGEPVCATRHPAAAFGQRGGRRCARGRVEGSDRPDRGRGQRAQRDVLGDRQPLGEPAVLGDRHRHARHRRERGQAGLRHPHRA